MSAVELRAPAASDVAALLAMINLPGVRRGSVRIPYTAEPFVRARFLEGGPLNHSIVAAREDALVGAATLLRRTGRQAHVGEVFLFVHDAHVGRGVGRALLEGLTDLADGWLGLRRLELDVATWNEAAIALYESCGFEREGLKRGDVLTAGVLEDSLLMARLRPAPERTPG